MVNWEYNSRPPPRVRKTDTFIVFCLFVLHSVTCLKTCHFAACFMILWTSISVFYVKTARDVVTVLLIFAKYLSLYLQIFTAHTGAHTHKHTFTISTQQEWRQPGTGVCLRAAEERLCWRPCTHTQKKQRQKTNLKKRFEHIELPAKLLDYFLRSNKSNINQSFKTRWEFTQSRSPTHLQPPKKNCLRRWPPSALRGYCIAGMPIVCQIFPRKAGHEMRGPAGTGRGGVSMAGGREGQGASKGNWVRGHRLPSPPCFV